MKQNEKFAEWFSKVVSIVAEETGSIILLDQSAKDSYARGDTSERYAARCHQDWLAE